MIMLWRFLIILAAIIIGAGTAAVTFSFFSGEMKIFPLAFVFIAISSAVLGIPAYLVLKSAGRANWVTAAVAGFSVGAIIPAIIVLPGSVADQASVDGVPTVINGSYTWAGWTQALGFVAGFGLLGVLGAIVFFLVVSRGQGSAEDGLKLADRWRGGSLMAVALCVVIAAFTVAEAGNDRSCHNPLRDGGDSIAPVANFDLKVGVDQWRRAERIVHNFGTENDWNISSDVRPDDDFKWFQMSLCREPGTQIAVQGYADFGTVSVAVMQPQGGDSWRKPFAALLARVETAWPKSVEFKGPTGQATTRPNWAPLARQNAGPTPVSGER